MKKKILRLDKILAHMGYGTRNDVKKMMRKGLVTVDGEVIKDSAVKVDPYEQIIIISGEQVKYREFVYLMLNKPAGCISATEDEYEETVLELIDDEYRVFSPFPVGRLDKDTEGLLLLTNDGDFAHNLTSPKRKVPKTYYAQVRGQVSEDDCESFKKGVILDDGYLTKPAVLIINNSGPVSEIELTITEGKFHQVKRMFQAVDKEVIYLKRLSIGNVSLDEDLELGSYRELTEEEIRNIAKL
ncbi:MAG: 16S rRNA pseudouridine(516) synthase [Firmicutes bacterium HGW-Firmicutes-12]|jgi:16S rRNA pseudouridine516 synthase|nr:MAG: 16S rRNA pseudouridine(516) synthase [Firmicutes bacterium HGW-Firmicutes-12]